MTTISVQTSTTIPSPLLPSDVREDLCRYAEAGGFTLRAETHPWYAALDSVSDVEEARAASTVLAELRGRDLPLIQHAAEQLGTVHGFDAPGTFAETATLVSLMLRVRATLAVLRPEAYEIELDALLAATATNAWRAERGMKQSWLQRFALGRQARRLTLARTGRADLHLALGRAAAERDEWAALTREGGPTLPTDQEFLDQSGPAADAAMAGLPELARLIGAESALEALPLSDLADLLDRLAADEGTLYRLPRLRTLRDGLLAQGQSDLLSELTARQADAAETEALLAPAPAPAPEPLAVPAAAAEPEALPAVAAEAEPEADPTPAAEPQAEAVAAATTEPEAEATLVVTAEPEPEAVATLDSEPEDVTAVTAEAEPEADPTPAAEPQAEAVTAATTEPEAEATPEVTAEPEAAHVEDESDTADAQQAEAETAPEPELEVEQASEPAAEDEAAAEVSEASAPEATADTDTQVAASDGAPAPALTPETPKKASTARRPQKPAVTPGQPVTAYSADELEAVVHWIDSDAVERTNEELLRAAMKELGFSRLGPRIKEALGTAVAAVRG
ncbi:hypothetical protein ABIA32_006065 [Streptacidiphilus sp. MAP12-20]|uniref:hypothetical protein n=1 Tax=Streptacidiphilus sp. MAP12-20 TaxID=3156299 RepID=UPI003511A656